MENIHRPIFQNFTKTFTGRTHTHTVTLCVILVREDFQKMYAVFRPANYVCEYTLEYSILYIILFHI